MINKLKEHDEIILFIILGIAYYLVILKKEIFDWIMLILIALSMLLFILTKVLPKKYKIAIFLNNIYETYFQGLFFILCFFGFFCIIGMMLD